MRIARSMSDDEGISALHHAVESADLDLVRYLLDHGARVDLEDWSGRTPLNVANGVPRTPIPQRLAEARVPNPYGVEEVEEDVLSTGTRSGRLCRKRSCGAGADAENIERARDALGGRQAQ
jgi:ankyrin repeat protein